jgi:hypothetical protein
MASHYRLRKFQCFTNVAVSSTNTYTSSVVEIENLDNVYLQLETSGTPTGAYIVQVSNDYNQDAEGNVLNAGQWVTLNLSPSPTIAAGSPSPIGIDMNQLGAPFLRVQYTNASGTGTINGFVSGKMLG